MRSSHLQTWSKKERRDRQCERESNVVQPNRPSSAVSAKFRPRYCSLYASEVKEISTNEGGSCNGQKFFSAIGILAATPTQEPKGMIKIKSKPKETKN